MFRLRTLSITALLLLMLVVVACGPAPTPLVSTEEPANQPAPTATATVESEAESELTAIDFEKDLEQFDANNFSDPTHIDNEWYPLAPGTQWVFEGSTIEGGLEIPHRIIFTVTDLTKEINGVRTVVAWIEDWSDEQLVESEIAFYAQDDDGNVWYLGEYPEEYENGKFVDAPAWIAGLKGARAGIMMKTQPQAGAPSYSQGWGPAVNWTDRAQVTEVGQQSCVPVDCYDDVIITEEFNLEEAGAFQLKYYARGVGQVQVGWRGEDATQETLELTELNQLGPEALEEVRTKTLEQEERAYEISKEVYDQTPPAE